MGEQLQDRPVGAGETTIACLIVSHRKPTYVLEALHSVLRQSYPFWRGILIDSGELYDQGYFRSFTDARLSIVRSPETAQLRIRKAMAPWCFNQYLPHITEDLIVYLCDDDLWYENAFATFVQHYNTTRVAAMYASQDTAVIDSGCQYWSGERRATQVRTTGMLDCVVDYLQLCHTRQILEGWGPEYWPESKQTAHHADGIFMEKLSRYTAIYPIDIKVGQNRRTPISTYGPYSLRN